MSTTRTVQTSTASTRLTADQHPPSQTTQPSHSNSSNSTPTASPQQNPASATESTQSAPPPSNDRPDTEELDIYDEIEIEDMTYDATLRIYHYPCPCGDRFEISVDAMRDGGEDVAVCPGCSLMVRVVFDVGDLPEE